uniref:hypothetical protein n=1 Tax=Synechococcus elongatus TaxID=32046 RepID=UPI001866B13C|nr:hypothetical protein [Synechococcus elongatus]
MIGDKCHTSVELFFLTSPGQSLPTWPGGGFALIADNYSWNEYGRWQGCLELIGKPERDRPWL